MKKVLEGGKKWMVATRKGDREPEGWGEMEGGREGEGEGERESLL